MLHITFFPSGFFVNTGTNSLFHKVNFPSHPLKRQSSSSVIVFYVCMQQILLQLSHLSPSFSSPNIYKGIGVNLFDLGEYGTDLSVAPHFSFLAHLYFCNHRVGNGSKEIAAVNHECPNDIICICVFLFFVL